MYIGDIMLQGQFNIPSTIIRLFGVSAFSHAIIVTSLIKIIEANSFGVVETKLQRYKAKGNYLIGYKVNLPVEKKLLAIDKVRKKYLGIKYGWKQLLGILYTQLTGSYRECTTVNPFNNGIICTELIYYYLTELGLTKDWGCIDPDSISLNNLKYYLDHKTPNVVYFYYKPYNKETILNVHS